MTAHSRQWEGRNHPNVYQRTNENLDEVHPHNGASFSLKKEAAWDTGYTWVSLEDTALRETSQSQKDEDRTIPLT